MPTHILVECPELIVSASLGVISALKPMEERGLLQVRFMRTTDIRKKDISWTDTLITVRGCEPLTVNIIKQAKKAGRLIIYYLDDDLLHIPAESLSREYYDDPIIRDGMKKSLELADILWGVNPNIKNRYLQFTQGRWIQNRVAKVPENILQTGPDLPIKILYAGSIDHEVIVREILAPVALRLYDKYGERVDFTFIGADPGICGQKGIHFIPFIKPYEAYCEYVKNGNFSIGLAPGRLDEFFACTYYNKYLEYSTIGAVGVYTNADPYTQIVSDGINGILCENTVDGWCSAIERLLNDSELLRFCVDNSRKILKDQFNVTTVTDELLDQCPEFREYRAPECNIQKIHIGNSFLAFYWGRTTLLWRQRGVFCIPEILFRAIKVLFMTSIKEISHFVQNIFRWNKEQ